MTIQDLKNLANEYLQAADTTQPQRLRERVMVAHTRSVTKKLLTILDKKEPVDVLAGLEALLKDNWQGTQRTMLCYTAIAESDITHLLIKTAAFIAQSRQERPVSVFELLMPGVATESLHDSYPDLHTDDVHTLLSRHVLGAGSYLIPVKLLAELDADARLQLYNPYYDFQRHTDAQATLNEAELERLYQHSPETRALKAAYDTYQTHIEDKSTLLDNLMDLCAKLHMNSVDMQGTEGNAGSGAYPAIFAFNDYYASLAEAEKARIPQEVRGQINKLLALSSDQQQNKNATANVETCLATRRGELLEAIKGQEATLANIAVSDAHKKNLTIAAKQHIEQCQHELKMSLEKGSYCGHDSFGLSRGLLKHLDIHLSVSSLADLHDFLSLTPDEMTELGQTLALKLQIIRQVKTLEEWIILANETPLPKLEALMALVGEPLVNTLIEKPVDIAALLMTLTPERVNVVCGAIKGALPDIIRDGDDFGRILQLLTVTQCTSVCSAIKDKLPDIIKNGQQFWQALEDLTIAQCTGICIVSEEILPEIIKNGHDLKCVLSYLTIEQRTRVYNAIKDKLPEIIQNGWDFRQAFEHLTLEQRTSVYSAMKDKLPEIIENSRGFGQVLEYLTPEQCTSICIAMNDTRPDFIKNSTGFAQVLSPLSTEQRNSVYSAMTEVLPEFIKHAEDFLRVLEYLTSAQRADVYSKMSNKLPEMIQSANNFAQVLEHLTSAQRADVYSKMSNKLPEMSQYSKDFARILEHSTLEQRADLYNTMSNKLPEIIQNAKDFAWTLKYLTIAQRADLYSTVSNKLPGMIQNGKDFAWALKYLTPEQRTSVYTAMSENDKLLDIIEDNAYDLGQTLLYLTPEQCSGVCAILKDKPLDWIKNSWDFVQVLRHLSLEQCTSVCTAMRGNLCRFIKNGNDLGRAFHTLTPEQCTTVCTAMEDKLPDIINNVFELKFFMLHLPAETQKHLFASGCTKQLLAKRILNVTKEVPACHKVLHSDDVKNAFNQALFSGLLHELEKVIQNNHAWADVENDFCQLKIAANGYFNAYPNEQGDLEAFQETCQMHVSAIQTKLSDNQSLATILGKILLAVVSFGLLPLASAIKNKYQTGNFQCRFFDISGVREADAVSELSNIPSLVPR